MYLADRIGISLLLSLSLLFTCAQIENGILISPKHDRPQRDTHVSPAYPHLFSKYHRKKAHRISVCCLFSNLSVEPFQLKYPTPPSG